MDMKVSIGAVEMSVGVITNAAPEIPTIGHDLLTVRQHLAARRSRAQASASTFVRGDFQRLLEVDDASCFDGGERQGSNNG